MRQHFRGLISGGILLLTACTDWRTPERSALQVDWSTAAEGLAEPVVEIHVRHSGSRSPLPQDMALFEGDITESALHDGDFGLLSRSLQEKRVPLRVDPEPDASLRVIPQRALSAGFRYTLAARGLGRVALLEVTAASERVLLRRVWPRGAALGSVALFCGGAEPLPAMDFELDGPSGADEFRARARFSPQTEPVVDMEGRVSEACAWLELMGAAPGASGPAAVAVNWAAPLRFEGYLLEPYNLGWLTVDSVERPSCTASEVELGPACAQVLDDRVIVLAPNVQSAWLLESGERNMSGELRLATEGERVLFRGFMPELRQTLRGWARFATGQQWEFEREVTTARAEPHLQISELLANPLGSEPQSEWIELLNDGAAEQDLEGFSLDDGSGSTVLPHAVVQPGEYVLVVRDDFVGGDPDVPAMPDTQLVHVPSLGKAGLANAGEVWTLRDPNQRTLSVFPAIASKNGGQSLARRSAQAADSSSSFGPHAAPGASPGAANTVTEP